MHDARQQKIEREAAELAMIEETMRTNRTVYTRSEFMQQRYRELIDAGYVTGEQLEALAVEALTNPST